MRAEHHTESISPVRMALLALGMMSLGLAGSALAAPEFSASHLTPQNVGTSAITAAAPRKKVNGVRSMRP